MVGAGHGAFIFGTRHGSRCGGGAGGETCARGVRVRRLVVGDTAQLSRFGARGRWRCGGPQKAHIRHIQAAPGVIIASVARVRLLVVVMSASKADVSPLSTPAVRIADIPGHPLDTRPAAPARPPDTPWRRPSPAGTGGGGPPAIRRRRPHGPGGPGRYVANTTIVPPRPGPTAPAGPAACGTAPRRFAGPARVRPVRGRSSASRRTAPDAAGRPDAHGADPAQDAAARWGRIRCGPSRVIRSSACLLP